MRRLLILSAVVLVAALVSGSDRGFLQWASGLSAPVGGETSNYLKGDGSWGAPGGGASWGGITGTLSDQTDLQTALDGKEAAGTFSGVGACAANQWASTLNDGAAPTCTQPAFSNLSGTATDANALADQVSSNTANLTEGKSARAINTKFGSSLGVDTANADMLVEIEGVIVVSATGSLELKHASEVAASSQVMAETTLELHKIG